MFDTFLVWFLLVTNLQITSCFAQTISTSIPVPPLQWINLTSKLNGASPPPLKDASVGYDEGTRTLIVFGGESEGGFVQSKTYLLNLDSLLWSSPQPPANLQNAPSPRSAALGGLDFAASNRHGYIIIGGKGQNGALSDVWEFDFVNQFWSQISLSPGGPSPRWGASGGIDFRTNPIQDVLVPGPNNTFYLTGGFDGSRSSSFPELWRLNISGTLSSNLPNGVQGSWEQISVNSLPSPMGQAGTIISQRVISIGGCGEATAPDSCSSVGSFVVDSTTRSFISPGSCPSPRKGAILVPNNNQFSTSFSSQVFLILGASNTTLWNDGGGLARGEVAVLDIQTGSWGRVLPSGDPDNSGEAAFPTPREGAAAFSWSSGLVGHSRSLSSDTLIFGGRDANGRYLSELWLLRSYNGTITHSNQSWTGFGSGQLDSGVDASGQGVTVQYMAQCAIALVPANNQTTSNTTSPSAPAINTPISHKALAPISVSIILFAIFLYRIASPSVSSPAKPTFSSLYLCISLLVIAFGTGVGGIITPFVSTQSTNNSSVKSLGTIHGRVGLALFLCLYGAMPFLFLLRKYGTPPTLPWISGKDLEPRTRTASNVTEEKPIRVTTPNGVEAQSVYSMTPQSSLFPTSTPAHWPRTQEDQGSLDTPSEISPGTARTFEVTNRPPRVRHISSSRLSSNGFEPNNRIPQVAKTLGEMDWLERRRSLNAIGELDYNLTLAQRALESSTPATVDHLLNKEPLEDCAVPLPSLSTIFIRCTFHASLLAICIFVAYSLWIYAPRFAFALFTSWTIIFYMSVLVLAWYGRPSDSVLAILFSRLQANPRRSPVQPHATTQPTQDGFPFPTTPSGPYMYHQPPFRLATSVEQGDSILDPRSVEGGEDDEIEDEDARQQMFLEEEMGRRDISIITVPRRRLHIANPS